MVQLPHAQRGELSKCFLAKCTLDLLARDGLGTPLRAFSKNDWQANKELHRLLVVQATGDTGLCHGPNHSRRSSRSDFRCYNIWLRHDRVSGALTVGPLSN